jgi:apolipoprotein D and lipocalin family protein
MTSKLLLGAILIVSITTLFSSCASIPKNASPVENFDVDKYLGSWYEIARFDQGKRM